MNRRWMIPVAAAATAAILIVARPAPEILRPAPKATPVPAPERPERREEPATVPPAPAAARPTESAVPAPVADRPMALALESTRQIVQADLERIHREMGKAFADYPVDLPDVELQRIQAALEERFRLEKETALSRLEVFLDEREEHRRIRDRLEEWVLQGGR